MKVQYILLQILLLSVLISCGGGNDKATDPTTPLPSTNTTPEPNVPEPGNVIISGKISYDFVPQSSINNGLDYNNISQKPVRGVKVQAILSDENEVASGITDNEGNYSLNVPADQVIRIRVFAQILESDTITWDVQVTNNTNNDSLYVLDGGLIDSGTTNSQRNLHAGSGWGESSYTGPRSAAPFAILDSIYLAMQFVRTADQNIDYTPLTISWSADNRPAVGDISLGEIGTSFYIPKLGQIYLLGKEDLDTDEYDRNVIIHEWGHYFQDTLSRSDSDNGSHLNGDRLDMRIAFDEAWATAMSSMVLNNPVYSDTFGSKQLNGMNYTLDDNTIQEPGWYNEKSIQAILYDLFDENNDTTDTVSLGFAPLHAVMINEQRTTSRFTSIFTFITALKNNNIASQAAINTLVNGQNIVSSTINAEGSTETNSAGSAQVLPIYTNLPNNSSPVNLCMSDYFGTGNKLGNVRFLMFTVANQGSYTIQANRSPSGLYTSDPDFYLYKSGELIGAADSSLDGTESLSKILAAGEYVLKLEEFKITADISPRDSSTCYDISLVME